jgi:N-acetylglucosamine kinase-like BadF-type ATPase
MSLYIGIEGVGFRQSVAVAADGEGKIVATHRMLGEPLALHGTDRGLLRTRLARLIREIARLTGKRLSDLSDSTVCIGLTGVSFPFDAQVDLAEEFEQLEIKVGRLICTGDAEIILASHALSLEGSTLLCGTGSAAYISAPTCRVRFGGWGPAIEDRGSGFWIGTEALRAVTEDVSAGEPSGALWKAIDDWLLNQRTRDYPDWQLGSIMWSTHRRRYSQTERRYDSRTALLSFANQMSVRQYSEWRALVAGLVIPVMAAWDAGDSVAAHIVARAAVQLGALFRQACSYVNTQRVVSPLVMYGGVLVHNPQFLSRVVEAISDTVSRPDRILTPATPGTMRPACGALLLALGRSVTGALALPSAKVMERVQVTQANLHREGDLKND